MSHRVAKTTPKIFETDHNKLKNIVLKTMKRASDAVGSSLGPSGRPTLIESNYPNLPHTITKDGVTIFKALGASDAYEHLILETARDAAQRTVEGAGDGTTTSTVLSYSIVKNLFEFCDNNKKYSPQKAVRRIHKVTESVLIPYIMERSIKINDDNKNLLKMVAKVSANGDSDIAEAVLSAFDEVGYGSNSHITIRQMSGKAGYKVEKIDGLPIPVGFEDVGKLYTAFINDTANQRCFLEKPLFLLFDGQINDLIGFLPLMETVGNKYIEGNGEYKNLVLFAHGFSENVLTNLAFNFSNPNTLNVLPMLTPLAQFSNSQQHFLQDLAAFTGAKVFGMQNPVNMATLEDLGGGMESFECYRFRSTVVGDPDPVNVEVRADDLSVMLKNAESQSEKIWLQERLGKLVNGIAKLTIYGGSSGEIKEKFDRVEDSIAAVRSSISDGALPGGTRLALDMAMKLAEELEEGDPAREVLMPSLMSLPMKLLDNAGYSEEEIQEVIKKLVSSPELVYDVENATFGDCIDLGLLDATKAVSESLRNAVSIAGVLGTLGGIVCAPRDDIFERSEARADSEFMRNVENPNMTNEADERG